MTDLVQQVLGGLTLGCLYALIALGYTLVYGILQLINFAHGEIMMFGAFYAWSFLTPQREETAWGLAALGAVSAAIAAFDRLRPRAGRGAAGGAAAGAAFVAGGAARSLALGEVPFLAAVALALPFAALLAVALERLAYRPLRGQDRLIPLISAIGASLFLQNLGQVDPWFFGTRHKPFPTPDWLQAAAFSAGGVRVSNLQLVVFVSSVAMMAGLYRFITRTRLGTAMRATSQDLRVAALMGVDTDGVIALTFALGAVLAAVAGVLYAMYLGTIYPFIGYMAGIKAFTAAVLGGIGNVPGAMLGGLLLGVLESIGAAFIDPGYKDAIAFVVLILVLLFRPRGILGERVAEKV